MTWRNMVRAFAMRGSRKIPGLDRKQDARARESGADRWSCCGPTRSGRNTATPSQGSIQRWVSPSGRALRAGYRVVQRGLGICLPQQRGTAITLERIWNGCRRKKLRSSERYENIIVIKAEQSAINSIAYFRRAVAAVVFFCFYLFCISIGWKNTDMKIDLGKTIFCLIAREVR